MTSRDKLVKGCAIGLAVVIIVSILSLVGDLINGVANFLFGYGEKISFSKSYEYVDSIEIDATSVSVVIEEGTEFKVEAWDVDDRFKVSLENNTLKIEESSSWFLESNGKIVITVLESSVLEELSIDTGAGKFVIDGIKVGELDIDHGAGMLEIVNSYIDNAFVDGGIGEMAITNTSLGKIELDSGLGKVELVANVMKGGKISCGLGSVDITLLGNKEDYSVSIDKGVGSVRVDGINKDNGDVYGSGSRWIEVEGGVGSINIDFE